MLLSLFFFSPQLKRKDPSWNDDLPALTSSPLVWDKLKHPGLLFRSRLGLVILLIARCLGRAETRKRVLIYLSDSVYGKKKTEATQRQRGLSAAYSKSCLELLDLLSPAGQETQMRQDPPLIRPKTPQVPPTPGGQPSSNLLTPRVRAEAEVTCNTPLRVLRWEEQLPKTLSCCPTTFTTQIGVNCFK